MQAHRLHVLIPEDRRATIQFPGNVRTGPAELIVLVPSEEVGAESDSIVPTGRGRLKALAAELAQESRAFAELTPAERGARLDRVMGVGRGLMSTSEELAQQKRFEVELEERKFAG